MYVVEELVVLVLCFCAISNAGYVVTRRPVIETTTTKLEISTQDFNVTDVLGMNDTKIDLIEDIVNDLGVNLTENGNITTTTELSISMVDTNEETMEKDVIGVGTGTVNGKLDNDEDTNGKNGEIEEETTVENLVGNQGRLLIALIGN